MIWKADQIQGVVFPMPGSKQSSALELWGEMFPQMEPGSYQGAGQSPIAATQASGKIDDLQVSVGAQIGRIDISISPNPSDQDEHNPPQIADIASAMLQLQKHLTAVIGLCRVARVATVAQLSIHFNDAGTITSFINESAGTNFPPESTDNIYQMNVRRAYNLSKNTLMNRVVTWNSGMKQIFNAQIDLSSNNFGMSSAVIIPVAALKLDINSATNKDITDIAPEMVAEHIREIEILLSNGVDLFHD